MCYIFAVYNSHCFLEFCLIVVFVFYLKICITQIQITFYWIWPSWCHFIQLCRSSKDCGGCNCKMAILLPRWMELPPDDLPAGLVRTQRHARCSSPNLSCRRLRGFGNRVKVAPRRSLASTLSRKLLAGNSRAASSSYLDADPKSTSVIYLTISCIFPS